MGARCAPLSVGKERAGMERYRNAAAANNGRSRNVVSRELVEALTASIRDEPSTRHLAGTHVPDRDAVESLMSDVRELCFPGFFGRRNITLESLPLHVE